MAAMRMMISVRGAWDAKASRSMPLKQQQQQRASSLAWNIAHLSPLRSAIVPCSEERRSGLGYRAMSTKASSVNGEATSASLAGTTERKTKKAESKKKVAKESDMPKRPPSAYFIFMETFRKKFKEENPDVKGVTASAKAGGEKWVQLSEEEKAPYVAEVAVRKAQYEKAMAAYKAKTVES